MARNAQHATPLQPASQEAGARAGRYRLAAWAALILASAAAWSAWSSAQEAAAAGRADAREQAKLILRAAQERLESYFTQVGLILHAISLNDSVRVGSTASRSFINAVFQASYQEHQLSELYVIERDFDGRRRPLMTFERATDTQPLDAIHTPDRELAEYAVQIEQLRRFAAEPARLHHLSEPLLLCIGERGLVYSVAIRNDGRLVGSVSGMIPASTIEAQLATTAMRSRLVLQAGSAEFSSGAVAPPDAGVVRDIIRAPVDRAWTLELWFDARPAAAAAVAQWALPGAILILGAISAFMLHLAPRLIAARRTAERSRRQEAALAHLARVTTVSELSAGLAHELAQPLAAIATLAEAGTQHCAAAGTGTADLKQDFELIREQAGRAGRIMDFLRGFVRRNARTREPCDLAGLVRGILDLLAAELRQHGTDATMEAEPSLPPVEVEVIALEQVLLNLLRNAMEAVAAVPPERRKIHVSVRRHGARHVVCEVTDRGHGATPETMARLFEPLFTTRGDGLGLGLSICRSIVEAHGGHIEATAALPHGLTVAFVLPAGATA